MSAVSSQVLPADLDAVQSDCSQSESEPNTQLAVILLAAGCTASYVREQCGFRTVKAAQHFARDAEVRQAVRELSAERAQRVGQRALVKLESLLAREHTDLRATVLAVRTALEVAGMMGKDIAPPVKLVRELTVGELSELIETTRKELHSRGWPDRAALPAPKPAASTD